MKVILRNVLGISRADMDLDGITLISGPNGAGKSSAIQSIGAALAQDPLSIRGVTKKNATSALVHRGAVDGGCRIIFTEADQAQVKFPEGELMIKGAPPALNPYVIGLKNLLTLPDKERSEILINALGAVPVKDDLLKALGLPGTPEAPALVKPDLADRLWEMVEQRGWDGAMKAAVEKGQQLKGQWAEVTGQTWGSKVGAGWVPAGADGLGDLDMTLAEQESSVKDWERRLQEARDAAAVATFSRKEQHEQVARLPQMREELATLQADRALALSEGEKLSDQLKAEPPVPGKSLPCPHCQQPITLEHNSNWSVVKVVKGVAPMPSTEEKKLRERRIDLEFRISEEGRKLQSLDSKITIAEANLDETTSLSKKLKEVGPNDKVEQAVADAERWVEHAKKKADAIKRRDRAAAIHALIVQNAALQLAVGPNGCRRAVLLRSVDAFNTDLATVTQEMRTNAVQMGEDLTFRYGDTPYALASQSEGLRTEIVVRAALAKRTDTPLILIDGFDVIQPNQRGGIVTGLSKMGLGAVIGMMQQQAADVPDLQKTKLGRTYWIENGQVALHAG